MSKKKWYHVADNTIIDCPSVNYKYNRDTYLAEKKVYWGISIGGLIVAFGTVVFCDNSVIQTIAGALMGGLLSLIVWLFTIRQQDKMNYEIAAVDMHLMIIDDILELQGGEVKYITPEQDEIVQHNSDNIIEKFLHLLVVVTDISNRKELDVTRLKIKDYEGKEYTPSEYVELSHEIALNHFNLVVNNQDKWDEIIAWNNYCIDLQLNNLKRKLLRYKNYIMCGNAPNNYNEYKRSNQ